MGSILNFDKWRKLHEAEEAEMAMATSAAPGSGIGSKVVGMIMKATSGIGTDEQMILDALKLIKNDADYKSALNVVKTSANVKSQYGRNFNTIVDMIETDFSEQLQGQVDWNNDRKWLKQYSDILMKYNTNEQFSVKVANWEI